LNRNELNSQTKV